MRGTMGEALTESSTAVANLFFASFSALLLFLLLTLLSPMMERSEITERGRQGFDEAGEFIFRYPRFHGLV